MALGPGDFAQHGARGQLLCIQSHALHDLLDNALLVVLVINRKGAGQALVAHLQGFDVAAQNADAERVEGAQERLGQRGVVEQPVHAGSHFGCCLVGEGEGQDGVRRDAFFADQPGDAAGDDAGFARAGSSENQQRPLGGFDRGALFRVQFVDERLQGASPGGKVPSSSVPFRE